ncbi:hypothetical protein [Salinispira pacifica]|uniref:Uncharacterized protein n=1 Tax=Salinispira pacifica TaxID=1307761 RepID=V5WLS1_9SPIO|nr:hypothetical protein [Salinispira pacifica]AHC16563.1 hypothetical protein L21SP2_3223 [Salinispira pacifica]
MSSFDNPANILVAVQSGKMIRWHLVNTTGHILHEKIFEHGTTEISEDLARIVYRIHKLRHDPGRSIAAVVFTNLNRETADILKQGIAVNDHNSTISLSPARALAEFNTGQNGLDTDSVLGAGGEKPKNGGAIYLVIDEILQAYVPGRDGSDDFLFTPESMILRSGGYLHPAQARGSAGAEFSQLLLTDSLSFSSPEGPLEVQARFRSRLRRGEKDAREYYSRYCENLAVLCINLNDVFPHRKILLYGPLVSSDPMFRQSIREKIGRVMYPVDAESLAGSVTTGLDYLRSLSSGAGIWFGRMGGSIESSKKDE